MTVKFCSFASSSSGNCYMVKDDNTAILIDAGISGKKIFRALEETETSLDMVEAVLVTHEHTDHVKSLPILTKKLPRAAVYANRATWDEIDRPVAPERRREFITGEDFYIGDFTIRPFAISHDAAEPVGFSIYHGEVQISICTDAGYVGEDILEEIKRADLLLLEANHEKEMLLYGRYPYPLKQRILGDEGHLSNLSCGECLCRIIREQPKERMVMLGHLSRENNTPEVALQAVVNTLEEQEIFVGGQLKLQVARRDERSEVYEL
ncbi:MAG: MBL fold metallo-hydrolase [Firmicutes bacterium]|nr:MBL fold metallo-hydrolase [Bacillota bacterium]MDY6174764.1 MBL fold metallo-hydrolase [Lentihominibacter sp.]